MTNKEQYAIFIQQCRVNRDIPVDFERWVELCGDTDEVDETNLCRHGQPDQNHEDWDVDYPCLDCLEDERAFGSPTGYDTLKEKYL